MAKMFFPQRLGRELHVVDVENLLGTPWFTAEEVASLRATYDRITGAATSSHYLIGTSADGNLMQAGIGWGQGRPVFKRGENGAERALLQEVTLSEAAKYGRVVIGSGDGYFGEFAAALQATGVAVTIVSRRDSLSTALSLAVPDKRYLPEFDLSRPRDALCNLRVSA